MLTKVSKISVSVIVALVMIALAVGGWFLLSRENNNPALAAEASKSSSQLTVSAISSTRQYGYSQVFLYYDNLGVGTVNVEMPVCNSPDDEVYNKVIEVSGEFTMSLNGYSWTINTFNATWYCSKGSTSLSASRQDALNAIEAGSGTSFTYSRSGNSFIPSVAPENTSLSLHWSSGIRYAAYVIKLEKPTSSVKANTYTLTFDYAGGSTLTGSKTVTYDAKIDTLPAPTRADYIFAGWYIGDTRIYETTVWKYTSNQTATAHWTFDGWTLSSSIGTDGGGSISGALEQYSKGATVRVQAVPNEGYAFDYWLLNGTRMTDNPLEFIIGQNSTLVAYFREVPTVVVSFSGGTGTTSTETVGTTQYVIIQPESGMYVNSINIDGISFPINYYEARLYGAGSANRVTYFAKDSTNILSMTFEYLFGRTQVTVTLSNVANNLQIPPTSSGGFGVSGVVVTASNGGEARITGFADDAEYVHFSAVNYTGYRFTGWTASDGTNLSEYGISANIPMDLVKNKVITANFVPIDSQGTNDQTDNSGDEFV